MSRRTIQSPLSEIQCDGDKALMMFNSSYLSSNTNLRSYRGENRLNFSAYSSNIGPLSARADVQSQID